MKRSPSDAGEEPSGKRAPPQPAAPSCAPGGGQPLSPVSTNPSVPRKDGGAEARPLKAVRARRGPRAMVPGTGWGPLRLARPRLPSIRSPFTRLVGQLRPSRAGTSNPDPPGLRVGPCGGESKPGASFTARPALQRERRPRFSEAELEGGGTGCVGPPCLPGRRTGPRELEPSGRGLETGLASRALGRTGGAGTPSARPSAHPLPRLGPSAARLSGL